MTLLTGDCVEVMAAMPEASVDAIVTDPPYGLEFMGKDWDRLVADVPNAAAWKGRRGTKQMEKGTEETGPTNPWGKESTGYRGGERHGSKRCQTCGRRQFSGTPCKCPEPVWETVYPPGPPTGALAMQRWHHRWATEALRVAKPGAYLLAFGGTRTVHRLTCAIEDAGWIIRDTLVWAYASGFPKSRALLKPAYEPIVMARKPGPLRELDIEGCRIGTSKGVPVSPGGGERPLYGNGWTGQPSDADGLDRNLGRWPANVILTDPIFDGGWDGVVGGGEADSGPVRHRSRPGFNTGKYAGAIGTGNKTFSEGFTDYGDAGTYSRFFMIPKAARAEREPGMPSDLEATSDSDGSPVRNARCRTCGRVKFAAADARCSCAAPEWVPSSTRRNTHPTVKPLDLMRHLVRLVTPTDGTVLDPFAGSGSTLIAAEMEGFGWLGIEREESYVAIAEARLAGVQRGLGLSA